MTMQYSFQSPKKILRHKNGKEKKVKTPIGSFGLYEEIAVPSFKFQLFTASGPDGKNWWYGNHIFPTCVNEIFATAEIIDRDTLFELALKECMLSKYGSAEYSKDVISDKEIVYKFHALTHQYAGGPKPVDNKYCPLKLKVVYK